MVRTLTPFALLIAGCATPLSEYDRLGSEPTPESWRVGRAVRFEVQDQSKRSIGQLTLRLTDERSVGDCVPDTWRKAEVVSTTIADPPLSTWYRANTNQRPSYFLFGRNLQVVLNPWICDSDVVFRGVVDTDAANGQFASEAMYGGGVYGSFVAVFVE